MKAFAGAALCVALVCGGVSADAGVRSPEHNPLRALFPSAAARAQEQAALAARVLERDLVGLPGVETAHVRVAVPSLDAAQLDEDPPLARVLVMLVLKGPGPSDDDVLHLARAVIQTPFETPIGLVRRAVSTPVEPHIEVRSVGPFEVVSESEAALRATLALCLGANVCLASIVLWQRRRRFGAHRRQ